MARRESRSWSIRSSTATVLSGDATDASEKPADPTSLLAASVGNLRAPTELGQYEPVSGGGVPSSPALRHVKAHPRILRTRQCSRQAVRRQVAPAAIREEREIFKQLAASETDRTTRSMSFCSSFSYAGMEVLVGTTETECFLLCARTHLVFQTLEPREEICLPDSETNKKIRSHIVSLRTHATSGQIVVVTDDGRLSSYSPKPSDPLEVNFGRFRWHNGPTADCARIFYNRDVGSEDDENSRPLFATARFNKKNSLEVSLADDHKILLAHGNQLTVLDADPAQTKEAEMVWTTSLPNRIVTAALSGDAHCIAVVLDTYAGDGDHKDQDAADADGVHTLERDWEDGSGGDAPVRRRSHGRSKSSGSSQETTMTAATTSSDKSNKKPTVGILYKPGPFLVHSAPVTRLSFRGKGRETSQPSGGDEEEEDPVEEVPGNDLLLTVSRDNTAQIFGQSNWKPLTEWTMSPKTRVDWISGTAAVTVGDLEGKSSASSGRKRSAPASASTSRQNSESSLADLERAEAVNETLAHRHPHFNSIPTHTTPVSKAGAWICEVCCQGPHPSVRLSRLTYLKRGADDLSPTLFESVSGYLPHNAVFSQCLLGQAEDAATLSVEGVWPMWNPFSGTDSGHFAGAQNRGGSDGDASSINDTLRGSAMDFLGLASTHHPVGAGGAFLGDAQLIGAQCPPTELRLTLSHPVSGHLTVLDYPVFGDKSLTNLELGKPTQSLLALSELSPHSNTSGGGNSLDIDSARHGGGRLVANIKSSGIVNVTLRQPGTLTILPSNWHAEDVFSPSVTELISNTKRMRDESLLPAPLALRPFRLPDDMKQSNDPFAMVMWWPHSGVAGTPPVLLCLAKSGRAVAFESVTPLVAATAEIDVSSIPHNSTSQDLGNASSLHDEDLNEIGQSEYEVSIVPDAELGLGLRLESLDDGQPAVAGSFKKNPVTGENLPAEKTGMITIGDALVSANGMMLEDKSFDEIIATVRELGASSGSGHPMRLRFRRQGGAASRARSNSGTSDGSSRRTMEQMFGVNADHIQKHLAQNGSHESGSSFQPSVFSTKPTDQSEGDGNRQVVGSFPNPIAGFAGAYASTKQPRQKILLLPCPETEESDDVTKAIICCIEGPNLFFSLLTIAYQTNRSEASLLHQFAPCEGHIESIHFLDRQLTSYFFFVLDKAGRARVVAVKLDFKKASEHVTSCFDVAKELPSVQLCAHSVRLFATLDQDCEDPLTMWSAKAQPGNNLALSDPEGDGSEVQVNYTRSTIRFDGAVADGTTNKIVDFCFVESGRLDADPWFVVMDAQAVTLHHRPGGFDEWVPLTVVFYSRLASSSQLGVTRGVIPPGTFGSATRPVDCFPHLLSALRVSANASDEVSFLRSDWHPEALLANLCMSKNGADSALKGRIRDLFLWLCSEGMNIQEDQADSPLLCAPLCPLDNQGTAANSENHSINQNVMASLVVKPQSTGDAEEMMLLKKLQKLLLESFNHLPQREQHHVNSSFQIELPPMLRSSSTLDLLLLWGIGELLVRPPDFRSTDMAGQLFIFSASLHGILREAIESRKEETATKFIAPSVLRRDPSQRTQSENSGPGPLVSSGACLAALMSNSQDRILEWVNQSYPKMDWVTAGRLRIPFWLRSDKSLARISEEIGQTIYREKRDVMECALFFIIARKLRTLRNLAATDQSESGRKFFNFMTTHDFSSDRGRRAAEKNAFSLLRKCRYRVASAFFLLAQPPTLQSALETIITKLHDVDLAFMVARLMESKELGPAGGSAMGGFGGVMGGGGGYAGPGIEMPSSVGFDTIKYQQWSPTLGKTMKKLLVERLFKLSADDQDNALSAIQLLWMNKTEEAAWWLPGFVMPSHTSESGYRAVDDIEGRNSERMRERGNRSKFCEIERANAIIDFTSIPFLQECMKSSPRSRYAGGLLVSCHLISRGVEIPSLWTAMTRLDAQASDAPKQTDSVEKKTAPIDPVVTGASSIFDSYDVPAAPRGKATPAPTSIFDSFDVPKQQPAQSSIFDSFDVPSPAKKQAPNGGLQSSIFDSFDVPNGSKKVQPSSAGGMQSSIFDDFDTPSQFRGSTGAPDGSPISDGPSARPNHSTGSSPGEQTSASVDNTPEPEVHLSIAVKETPEVWSMWKDRVVLLSITRRMLREVASVLASFHGDPPEISIEDFYQQNHPILSSGASEVLQVSCDANGILERTKESVKELAAASGTDALTAVSFAVRLLGGSSHHYRVLLSVLMYAAIERFDLAESMIRAAAETLIYHSRAFGFALDDTSERRQTRYQVSSIQVRRLAARICWQLETCLWLHRSGGIPLSGLAFKEATVAVRVGVLTASWNRTPEAMEAILRCEPDAIMDEEEGMNLWSSFKQLIPGDVADKSRKTSSGGWEFFVDCRRSEATKILRESPTGSFIIRPHPNDHGVFTLSFKTNLVPGEDTETLGDDSQDATFEETGDSDVQGRPPKPKTKKDDIVQHAIIRLSDSGFRCGSFGPFTSLLDLLESVSESLPFELRFDLPPSNRVIREEGSQPSPNAVLFRKLALSHASSITSQPPTEDMVPTVGDVHHQTPVGTRVEPSDRLRCFGVFLDLLVLSKVRRQLSGVAVVRYEDSDAEDNGHDLGSDNIRNVASWIVGPILGWCRSLEARAVVELAPEVAALWQMLAGQSQSSMNVSEQSTELAIEVTLGPHTNHTIYSGDAILRSMIQRDSGVEFSTLRLVDGGECSMVVLFSKAEAVEWLVSSATDCDEAEAIQRLERMERERVIEPIDFAKLPLKQRPADLEEGVRYRFVDPWEVEAVDSREGETRSASLGRQHFLGFSLGKIGLACESDFRILGGIPLLELWMSAKGGVFLSRALAAVQPPWERASGGDLQVRGGVVSEPEPFANSIRQHLYRNALFKRMELPQRFLALVQVEVLDLKNLTSPGGTLSLSAYALLRLKRRGSSGVLSNKTRTLDTASTSPMRLGKPTGVGPNAPASWGSVVRFRYPLPDDVAIDGTSFDHAREALFKGPPSVLQITVYEKKLLVDNALGTADVDMDGLLAGGQVEEWVPLRSEKHGIHWFTRIRITLRFELMCLASRDLKDLSSAAPSVGLQRIETLCRTGGAAAHEDHKRSISSPDLLHYLESMVY